MQRLIERMRQISLVLSAYPFVAMAQVPEQETIVTMEEVIFGEPQTYADISGTDAARSAAVESLKQHCIAWKKDVADTVKDKVTFFELDCDSENIKVTVERFGSGDQKTMQASVVAQLKIGPKYGYLLIHDAIRGWFGEERQNIVLAALKSYDARCKEWKKQAQATFGKSFIYANCGKTREIQNVLPPEPAYSNYGRSRIQLPDPPHIVPGTRVASQGKILILLEDMYQTKGLITVGQTDRVPCGGDPKVGRAQAENLYWTACANFKAEQRNRYGARLIYASCEIFLGSEFITGTSTSRWYPSPPGPPTMVYTCQGFTAKTEGNVWLLK